MKTLKIQKSYLSGVLKVPPSKSHTMRALLFGAMGKGETKIFNYLQSPDTISMICALRAFGLKIHVEEKVITITGEKLQPSQHVIDAGNSGIVLRFIGALSALLATETIITGDQSIKRNRPVQPMLSALTQLGAIAISQEGDGKPPLKIRGPLKPGLAVFSGEDSQPVSALLIATSFLSGTSYLEIREPGEMPWIDMTLSWLKRFGGHIEHENYKKYKVIGPISYPGFTMSIPGDFSSAAFPLVGALITKSKISLENLDWDDIQGDKKIIRLLQEMGASLEMSNMHLKVEGNSSLQGRKIDANHMIDAVPILAVLGCFAKGETEIINVAIARKKESDRIHAIVKELQKMGADIEERDEGLVVRQSKLKGAHVFSHGDHRIAMALIIAALEADGETIVEDVECISKSFPSFVTDFQNLGAKIYE